MGKLNHLNVGCGNKFHKQWVNVDMTSYSKDVISANLLKGIPFPDNEFDVLYHSQVLEHFPKEKAQDFMKECYRVLRKGGIIRVVVPNLENIIDEYKKFLTENIENPNDVSAANYDWILLEMYDQTVRNHTGGQMAEYLKRPVLINENYVIDRLGHLGHSIRDHYLSNYHTMFITNLKNLFSSIPMFKKYLERVHIFR
jgi:predicted SAM-dependent methyltransferase